LGYLISRRPAATKDGLNTKEIKGHFMTEGDIDRNAPYSFLHSNYSWMAIISQLRTGFLKRAEFTFNPEKPVVFFKVRKEALIRRKAFYAKSRDQMICSPDNDH